MLQLFLKWLGIALIALTAFSAVTTLWAWYQLQFGACAAECADRQTFVAYFYMGLIGIAGFGCSAIAARIIGRTLG